MFDVLFVNGKILRRDNLKDYHLNLIYVKLWLRGNSEAVVRREFIDALPNGWEDYAWRRINKGVLLNRCENKTYAWRNFRYFSLRHHPMFQSSLIDVLLLNYTEFVGKKSSFHLLNRGSAKALDKVVELDGQDIPLNRDKVTLLSIIRHYHPE
ncbi:hypothetical protein NC653_029666 [Populus alba x Populus x berolinensis]|uniref:Uncharacterized protein n=1 Tax=Populus alba x Populus x berolinensis TaxID=444605 RepID=A0AAD6M3P3_9ROSI|nr:hypothetical protein NC653_029666 [Populus alba x Populus x berolinensis]